MRIRKILSQTKNNGFALSLALFAIILLLLIGTGLLEVGLKARVFAVRSTSEIAARCAADAGITQALFEMNNKLSVKPWDGGSLPNVVNEPLLNSNALYSYSITGDINNGYSIVSTGVCGSNQKQIVCKLELRGPFDAAIFVKEEINLKNSAVIDWFNNGPDDKAMQVETNSTIPDSVILKNSSYINGDLVVGRDANPDSVIRDFGATITGTIYPMTQVHPIPDVIVPDSLNLLAEEGSLENNTTITVSAKYSSIDLKNNKTITIDGNISLYITGDIILKNSAEILIEEGSSLILYLGGDLEAKNSSSFNNQTCNPENFQIYALDSCESLIFKNSCNYYGTIYAPQAQVIFDNSADIYGAIVSKSYEQKNSSRFNYDASLRDAGSDDQMLSFAIVNWSEK